MLYLEGDNARCPIHALRQLFFSALYHWFTFVSDILLFSLSDDSGNPSWGLRNVVTVELLRSPFYLYVSPHIPTLLSVEINRHPQVP